MNSFRGFTANFGNEDTGTSVDAVHSNCSKISHQLD